MYEHAEKTPKGDSRAVANSVAGSKSSGKQRFNFINNRPGSVAQTKMQSALRMSNYATYPVKTLQLSDVVATGVDDDDGLTADKKIKTRNDGTAWFRFPKDDKKIDTFGDNETTSTPKGANPIYDTIEISDDAKANQYEIESLTRAMHFGAGDRLAGVSPSFRKGKWTWHHKLDPYGMELVDMAVHKSFGHYGGFSQWQEGTDDDNDN